MLDRTLSGLGTRRNFVSFAKCENSIEVTGHENMTLTQRMAQAPTKLHKKLSFNDVDPMTAIFTFSGSRKFDTFSVNIFDTFSVTCQFDTFSVDTFDTFSGPTFDTFSGPAFDTFSVDFTHLAAMTHLS